jgi:hypothetical protein
MSEPNDNLGRKVSEGERKKIEKKMPFIVDT